MATYAHRVDVLPPRSTDDEASALLDQLSRLQTWCTMQCPAPGAREAIDLVQRTRIFIIERCKRPAPSPQGDRHDD